jgi:hypothetical protein
MINRAIVMGKVISDPKSMSIRKVRGVILDFDVDGNQVGLFIPKPLSTNLSEQLRPGTALNVDGYIGSLGQITSVSDFLTQAGIKVPKGEVPPWLNLNSKIMMSKLCVFAQSVEVLGSDAPNLNSVMILGRIVRPMPKPLNLEGEQGRICRLRVEGGRGDLHHISCFIPSALVKPIKGPLNTRGTHLLIKGHVRSSEYQEVVKRVLNRVGSLPPNGTEIPPWLDLNASVPRISSFLYAVEATVVTPEDFQIE